MTGQRELHEAADSLKSCWQNFRRLYRKIDAEHPLAPAEETEIVKTGDALMKRCRRLRNLSSTEDADVLPESLADSLRDLAGHRNFSSLSDDRLKSFLDLAQQADIQIDQWLTALRRKRVYRSERIRREIYQGLHRFVTVPVVFTALVAVLFGVGIFFFLNRY